MTREEYMECLRDLNATLKDAVERGDEATRVGTVMAMELFLGTVPIPPEKVDPRKSGT